VAGEESQLKSFQLSQFKDFAVTNPCVFVVCGGKDGCQRHHPHTAWKKAGALLTVHRRTSLAFFG